MTGYSNNDLAALVACQVSVIYVSQTIQKLLYGQMHVVDQLIKRNNARQGT